MGGNCLSKNKGDDGPFTLVGEVALGDGIATHYAHREAFVDNIAPDGLAPRRWRLRFVLEYKPFVDIVRQDIYTNKCFSSKSTTNIILLARFRLPFGLHPSLISLPQAPPPPPPPPPPSNT